jgi:hypothetical protein
MNQESKYHTNYKNRMIVFMLITGVYLLFSATYTITGLFSTISWNDNGFLYAYCLYAIWFNAYNCYRYCKNSIEDEQKNATRYELFELAGLTPFNHKQGRRHIFLLSSLAIAINIALMIATRWLWV